MNLKKYRLSMLGLILGNVGAEFQQQINYTLAVPSLSTWGVLNTSNISGKELAQMAGVDSLQQCSINNNTGKKGILKGTITEFQIVPSLVKGVKYWNPLSSINAVQPCLVETFVSHSSPFTPSCAAPEVLIIDKDSTPSSKNVQNKIATTALDQRYQALTSQKEATFLKEYEALYSVLQKDLSNLMTIKQSMIDTSNFYSVLYLKFAATYGNQFVNKAQLQQSQSHLFGADTDISSYFKDGIFPIVCDLTVSNKQSQTSLGNDTISSLLVAAGGPLVRALQTRDTQFTPSDITPLLNQFAITFSDITQFLENVTHSSLPSTMVYNRARVTELFFLYLGILMGSNVIAGAPTYDKNFCSDISCPGNVWCPVPSPCEKMNTVPFSFYSSGAPYCFAQICSKLAVAARYMSILHDDTIKSKNAYAVQPVDRFYGMIVLNQSSYTITSNDISIAPGQVGMLKGAPGIDMWDVGGVNPESNYKYRSLSCNLFKGSDTRWIELRIEENFTSDEYDPSKVYVPPITLYNGVTNTQQDIVSKGYLENFFKVDPAVGWAVVLQMVDQPATDGSSNLILNMVGLARLNSYDFPLVYRSSGLENISVGPFSAAQLWQAPFLMYTKIVASENPNKWALCSTDTPPNLLPLKPIQLSPFNIKIPNSTTTKAITPAPINPYYIVYKSTLGFDFGSKNSLQNALQHTISLIKAAHFTLDDLDRSSLISLIKKASEDPQATIVQIMTTQPYRLTS